MHGLSCAGEEGWFKYRVSIQMALGPSVSEVGTQALFICLFLSSLIMKGFSSNLLIHKTQTKDKIVSILFSYPVI